MATSRIEFSWKRRPSEIRGYERAMYTTLSNGDYIRIDYNIEEKRVRLYLEVYEEKNAPYYSVINNGRIVTERNNSGKSARVGEKIKERSEEYSTFPNNEVLKLINSNYGIFSMNDAENKKREQQKKQQLDSVRKRYFRAEEEQNNYEDSETVIAQKTRKIGLIDLFDVFTGMALAGIFFIISQYSFLALGAFAVIWGIMTGLFDIVLRNREPVFTKILFFLISGSALYIYDYFNF